MARLAALGSEWVTRIASTESGPNGTACAIRVDIKLGAAGQAVLAQFLAHHA